MLIKDIPTENAKRLISAIEDLRPGMNVKVIAEDTALFDLGHSHFIPCSIEIEATEEEIDALVDEVYQMEADAWNFDEKEMINPDIAKLQRELEEKYKKYAIIVIYLG
ncbi:MAG: hypothetical protein IJJ85_01720 [Clostridia bacterium]|nr:hypothetical protein [Clostridia bacterium]